MSGLPRSCACGRIVAKGKTCQCRDQHRGGTTQRGYGAAWQRISAQVILEEGMCRDCGHLGSDDNPLTCDHIIPKLHGGTDDRSNLTCRCRLHNSSKGTKQTGSTVASEAVESTVLLS
jgi:hypothetical protein